MILIAKPGTETKPASIDLLTYNGNKFANVNKFGDLMIYGEDMSIINDEVKKVTVITENFSLFYTQLIRLQNEIQDLLTPTIRRQ